MKNPWTMKNPMMSIWLSGAHRVGGSARSHASAAVRRELESASTKAAADAQKRLLEFWSAALGVPPRAGKRKRR